MPNQQLAEELHKKVIGSLEKVYLSFKDNIWGLNLSKMQLISKFNKRIRFLLCAIDIFSKYAWAIPLKDKGGVTIVNSFQKKYMVKKENQTKYGYIQVMNFITYQWNHD